MLYNCGKIHLTLLLRRRLPQLFDQLRKRQQIRRPEMRPTGRQDHERVVVRRVRPAHGEPREPPFAVVEVDSILSPRAPDGQQLETATEPGVEWMRYTNSPSPG